MPQPARSPIPPPPLLGQACPGGLRLVSMAAQKAGRRSNHGTNHVLVRIQCVLSPL